MDTFGYTYREFNQAIGKSKSYINDRVQLLSLPESIREQASALRTRTRHTRHILKIKDNDALREKVFSKVIDENLTHGETSELVDILNDVAVHDQIKAFVLDSKELKPAQARQVIESNLPEKAILKIMKNIARLAAGKNTPFDEESIDDIIEKERALNLEDSQKEPQILYLAELVSRSKNLMLLCETNIEVKVKNDSGDAFKDKKVALKTALNDFLTFIGTLELET